MLEPNRNRANGCCKRKTRLEKILITCCVLLTLIAVCLAAMYFWEISYSTTGDECTTKHCVKAASEILDYIDLKEDPCKNFYRFVCGTYYKNAVKKKTTSPFITIDEEFKNEMKAIIMDPVRKKDTDANILVKKYYHQCLNESKIDQDDNKSFLASIKLLGGWPLYNDSDWSDSDFDWVDWYIKSKELGLPILEFFSLTKVNTGQEKTVLQVSAPTADPNSFLSKWKYNTAMQEVLEALDVQNFREEENEKVFEFIKKLKQYQTQKAVKEDLKGILKHLLAFRPDERLAVETVKDLTEACPDVPWLKLLNSMAMNEMKFDNSSDVAFGSLKQYCYALKKLLKATDARTIANYFVWSIIHQSHQHLSTKVKNAYGELKWSYEPRYKVCFEEADNRFKYVKESTYIRKRTPQVVKDQLKEMIDIMKEVFIEHIKVCDWMDDTMKDTAIRKTQHIQNLIGGDDELYDVERFDKVLGLEGFKFSSDNMFDMMRQKSIQDTRHFFRTLYGDAGSDWDSFFKNMVKLNAFFAPALNMMILPAPILSSIFFNHKMPAFMNYGSIGRLIGHEIMHGFEKSGRYVLVGSDLQDWWTTFSADAYDKKVQCVIDEYEKIDFRYKLNGTLTLDENISDFVGVDIAYEAYLRYIKKYGHEKKLPAIPLTPEQLFWVQTGTFLCFRKLDDESVDYEEEDEHAIPQFRVQGGARFSKYFAKDFNCPEGSHMNPTEKCRVL